jgi:glycosyltransferase involved in cell wall biosynthesis
MRVIIISRYCAYPSWQGSAQHAQTFAAELLRQGHQVILITGEDVDKYVVTSQDGYDVHKIPLPKTDNSLDKFVSPAYIDKDFFAQGVEIINNFNPDIVHLGAIGKMLSFVEAANFKKVPITAMVHDFFWVSLSKFFIDFDLLFKSAATHDKKMYLKQSSFKRKVLSSIVNNFLLIRSILPKKIKDNFIYLETIEQSVGHLLSKRDMITEFIVQNYDNKKQLINCGVTQKINFVGQALVDKKLVKYPKKNTKDSILHIGYIGRVSKEKGLHILFEALKNINDKSRFQLHIISQGVDVKRLTKLIGSDISDLNIKLYNDLSGSEEIPKAIAQFDVFISPSVWWEIGPRTVIESISQNVPCVVSNTTGNRYLIQDGVNGKIFKMNDSDELSNILNSLIDDKNILLEWRKKLPSINSEKQRTKQLIKLHESILNL